MSTTSVAEASSRIQEGIKSVKTLSAKDSRHKSALQYALFMAGALFMLWLLIALNNSNVATLAILAGTFLAVSGIYYLIVRYAPTKESG